MNEIYIVCMSKVKLTDSQKNGHSFKLFLTFILLFTSLLYIWDKIIIIKKINDSFIHIKNISFFSVKFLISYMNNY